MATRFELVLEHDKFNFHLRLPDGPALLTGLTSNSKIMTQNEVAHVRTALRDPACIVPHQTSDGRHFLVVKDKDGSVLAKSPTVGSSTELEALTAKIVAAAATAAVVDLSKRAAHSH